MNCHYCLSTAVTHVEKDGVKVGLCKEHLEKKVTDFELEVVDDELDDVL